MYHTGLRTDLVANFGVGAHIGYVIQEVISLE